MPTSNTLLAVRQGNEGTFVKWLEDVGLKDFIKRYPIPKLVEWGWLVPQSRIVFPVDYFRAWDSYPYPADKAEEQKNLESFKTESVLWDSSWRIDNQEPLWFLHPFFRPNNAYSERIENGKSLNYFPIPDAFNHSNGREITPYVDYYFHWQAYALIDVIRFAEIDVIRFTDCIVPIINTPDVEEQAQNIVQIAEQIKSLNPTSKAERQWIELAEPMTWLSHYRSLRNALYWNEDVELKREGARKLADYLQIDAAILERFIKEKLLVLAQDWLWENERYCVWTLRAWSELQIDVTNAVIWLCYLNGQSFCDYLELWQYKHQQQEEWAELHKVLPFEFFESQKRFLAYAPIYLSKDYEGILPTGEEFKQLVNDILDNNDYFHNLLSAFNQLHKQLESKNSLDFRQYRPLDYYSLLAIRAEDCLRYRLEEDGSLQNINVKDQNLRSYIVQLSKQNNNISQQVISRFESDVKNLTQLREKPVNPIGGIMEMELERYSPNDACLIKAFLCCNLARNYFAHHTYLDRELIRSEESGFMLAGILVTVLTLLRP